MRKYLIEEDMDPINLVHSNRKQMVAVSTEDSAGPGNVLRFNLTKFQFEETHEHKASWLH